MTAVAGGMPLVQNLILVVPNQEYVFSIPAHVKKFLLQAREYEEIKLAFKEGQSGTNYFSIRNGSTYFEDAIRGPFILALQSNNANTVVELITWSHWD